MLTENRTKINQLLSTIPQDVVLQSSWLINEGYSLDLQKYYRNSGWLKALGNGAMYYAFNKYVGMTPSEFIVLNN